MSKCKTCELRNKCSWKRHITCENLNYEGYIPDEKAIKEEFINSLSEEAQKLYYDILSGKVEKEQNEKDLEIERLKKELADTKGELRKVCSSVMQIQKIESRGLDFVEYRFFYDNRLSNRSAGEIAYMLLKEFIEEDERKRKGNN